MHPEERVAAAQLLFDVERRQRITLQHLGHRLDQRRDGLQIVLGGGEEIRAPDDAAVGLQVDEQQRRHAQRADARLERPFQRRNDRAHPDGADLQRIQLHFSHLPLNCGLRFSMNALRPSS